MQIRLLTPEETERRRVSAANENTRTDGLHSEREREREREIHSHTQRKTFRRVARRRRGRLSLSLSLSLSVLQRGDSGVGGIGIGGATTERRTDRLSRLRSLQSRGGKKDKQKTRFNWPKEEEMSERTKTKRGSGVRTADADGR